MPGLSVVFVVCRCLERDDRRLVTGLPDDVILLADVLLVSLIPHANDATTLSLQVDDQDVRNGPNFESLGRLTHFLASTAVPGVIFRENFALASFDKAVLQGDAVLLTLSTPCSLFDERGVTDCWQILAFFMRQEVSSETIIALRVAVKKRLE